MSIKRGSGILMHITSIAGEYGVGDLGRNALRFVDFLADSGQSYWQFLPLGPVSDVFDYSPYMSLSAFAGNWLLIDPDSLIEQGLLPPEFVNDLPVFSRYSVKFDKVASFKKTMLDLAYKRFAAGPHAEFDQFCREEGAWLDDYALFVALRDRFDLKPWFQWPRPLAEREMAAVFEAADSLANEIRYHKFVQFCFFTQWRRLHDYAKEKGVALIGDIPIYVSLDSADVWGNQQGFLLDRKTLLPTHVAGVPPDYFSETGQRWGNPLYRWRLKDGTENMSLYSWWAERFKAIFKLVDICRIDHFRGFESFWQIPAGEKTAVKGRWAKGPGLSFFERMASNIGQLPIIAEDLGVITPEVEALREELGLPGMKILQFAFDSDEHNTYLPHNFKSPNSVVFTGTHDNNTTLGWFMSDKASAEAKRRVQRYTNSGGAEIHWDFIRLAFSSIADLAIVPMQDILGFGEDCRMNVPGTSSGNWRWRLSEEFLTEDVGRRLRDETCFYGRK